MVAIVVIVPTWNGARLLPTCLDSLLSQTFRDFEVLVVDNGSTDDTRALLRSRYPQARVLALGQNLVFSGAVNAGLHATGAPLVALLNNDTEAEPGWLAALWDAASRYPDAGWFASKLLLFDRRDVLHSAGDFYGADAVPGNRGVWEPDDGRYDREEEVFGACGGAALYRRAMLEDVGLFDERLIGYCEDVDLNLRARLAGYRCIYVPAARVYHRLSATGGGPQASYLCGRNFIRVAVKCLPGETWRRHGRRIVAAQLALAAHALWHWREPAARARLRGQLAGLRALPQVLCQRETVQRRARVSPEQLERWLAEPSPPPWRPRGRPALATRAR